MADDERKLVGETVGGSSMDDEFSRFLRTPQFTSIIESSYPSLSPSTVVTAVPVGAVLPYAGSEAPDGWLMCDGSAVDARRYPELSRLIGSNTPNLMGRTVVGAGAGAGLTARALGATGGTESAVVVEHNHGGTTGGMNRNNPHGHTADDHQILRVYGAAGSQQGMLYESRASRDWVPGFINGHNIHSADINHEHSIGSSGESGVGKNMQPFYVLNFIIKAR